MVPDGQAISLPGRCHTRTYSGIHPGFSNVASGLKFLSCHGLIIRGASSHRLERFGVFGYQSHASFQITFLEGQTFLYRSYGGYSITIQPAVPMSNINRP